MKRHYCVKIVSMILLLSASISSAVFADVVYDCGLVTDDPASLLEKMNLSSNGALKQEDMENAMTDLKAYCCQQQILKNDCDSAGGNNDNPESPYIFDHLVSKWFFKLDNKTDGSKDSKAQERADKLKEREESGKWKTPVTIQNDFVEAWQPTKWRAANIKEENCEITNYDSLDMSARYSAVCLQSACITRKFFSAAWDLDQRYDERACESLAQKRIDNEMTYIQTLMVEKSNLLMKDVWQTYTQSYLLETRRNMFLEKLTHINESLGMITKKVQEWTDMCSAGSQ